MGQAIMSRTMATAPQSRNAVVRRGTAKPVPDHGEIDVSRFAHHAFFKAACGFVDHQQNHAP
jgi:hypothetical protein